VRVREEARNEEDKGEGRRVWCREQRGERSKGRVE
jgi:hypothetical protein